MSAQPIAPDGKPGGAATAVLHLDSGNAIWAHGVLAVPTEFKGDVWLVELGQ